MKGLRWFSECIDVSVEASSLLMEVIATPSVGVVAG